MIDLNERTYYDFDNPERTKKRLQEISDLGMEEVGYGQFGYKGVMSGLYIERVWENTDEDFNSFMDWAKDLIKEKTNKNVI